MCVAHVRIDCVIKLPCNRSLLTETDFEIKWARTPLLPLGVSTGKGGGGNGQVRYARTQARKNRTDYSCLLRICHSAQCARRETLLGVFVYGRELAEGGSPC